MRPRRRSFAAPPPIRCRSPRSPTPATWASSDNRSDRGRHAAETRSGMVNACSGSRTPHHADDSLARRNRAPFARKSRSRRVKESVGIVCSARSPRGSRAAPAFARVGAPRRRNDDLRAEEADLARLLPDQWHHLDGERDARGHGRGGNHRPRGDDGTADRAPPTTMPTRAFVQVPGHAYRTRGDDLCAVMRERRTSSGCCIDTCSRCSTRRRSTRRATASTRWRSGARAGC